MTISKDKYIDFYINHYSEIVALKEIIARAEGSIPNLLDTEMKNCFSEIGFDDIVIRPDSHGKVWYDPELYDPKEDKGPYFGYEAGWNSLFVGNDPSAASYLYLYIGIGNLKQNTKKREYIDRWIKLLHRESSKLKINQKINIVTPVDYSDPYLLRYPLHREVNMENIADGEKLKKLIQATIREFTLTCLSILKPPK